ncbi:MAG: RNA polymerase sigma-28 factor precursor [Firmicutes bacterium ADurb.Bin193]|nr:MAG: RNA polymerase sigma-28 factor precursor [Firmicutes bacterium ADurb.Bin193]
MFLSALAELIRQVFLLISYVSNVNSFPKPLTAAEEQHYLALYEQGDKHAKDVLIERNLRLVAHVAKKYSTPGKDADDIISMGTIGLIKGINSYKSCRGTRLSTYVARCIENEILMCIRSSKKTKNEVSIDDPIGFDGEGNQITFNDILGSCDDEVLEQVSSKIQAGRLYEGIDDALYGREKAVIELRYGLGNGKELTQKEVAKILGISRSYVSRIEKKAIGKLKKWMGKEKEG